VIVMLVDERPEEVTEWRRQAQGVEIAAAPADFDADDQVRHAELAIARGRRRAESGEDVVVVVDSLTRLGVAYRDPISVKPIFGAGRELEEEGAGSLTMAATVLEGDERESEVRAAVETTENVRLKLDAGLAGAGIFPSLVVAECSSSGEEELRSDEELERARELRRQLSQLGAEEAARALGERIAGSADNRELLS
jgi:transcription termination factor Rho